MVITNTTPYKTDAHTRIALLLYVYAAWYAQTNNPARDNDSAAEIRVHENILRFKINK